ncbi:major facilitator transporter [Streptococcus pyogenes]|nr:major facilitator transporter [Streptococcus pyogenes]VHG07954.1 major facilitator transporter [Streptococcus pyogenes]VHH67418.1 major facilitator transporter [Streptococcus pyogenes]VHJ10954.1 major facilitator transporter [Streptococcus pyogenes]
MVMIFLASLYVISIGAMWTIGQLKAERYQQLR